jgi:predicted transcriptional regulator
MSIADICRREIVSIDAAASLKDAAGLMRSRHVGALVVTVTQGEREQAVGMITDRDLAIEALSRGLDAGDVKVGQVASRHLASVPAAAVIAQAVTVMQQAGVRRLLVTEQEGQLVGFVSADDLLEALAAQLSGLAGALRSGIAREGAERGAISPPTPRPVFLPHGTPGMQQPIAARRPPN